MSRQQSGHNPTNDAGQTNVRGCPRTERRTRLNGGRRTIQNSLGTSFLEYCSTCKCRRTKSIISSSVLPVRFWSAASVRVCFHSRSSSLAMICNQKRRRDRTVKRGRGRGRGARLRVRNLPVRVSRSKISSDGEKMI